jgi:hypothetical protein
LLIIDIAAYSLPVITSLHWFMEGEIYYVYAAMSNLLLNLKFLFFLRIFKYCGKSFVIIIGVAEEVYSFLISLFWIMIGFAHAFLILLRPHKIYSLDSFDMHDNDPNNPWNLQPTYFSFNSNGTRNPNFTLIQSPDNKTNMFTGFSGSLLAMYLFLTGNNLTYLIYY